MMATCGKLAMQYVPNATMHSTVLTCRVFMVQEEPQTSFLLCNKQGAITKECRVTAGRYRRLKLLHVRVMVVQVSWGHGASCLLQRTAGAPVLRQESLALL